MIYFDSNKTAFSYKIENPIASIDDETWSKYCATDKWDIIDGEFTDISTTPEYIAKEEEKKELELAMKSLTKREVFLAIYRDKGITPEQIRNMVGDNQEALIEFDYANDYHRFNPLINSIGSALGYSKEDIDYLFVNKEFKK